MAVEGFKAVGVTDNHKVAVSANIVRYAHLTVKGCRNWSSGWIRQVYALVTAAVTVPEMRAGLSLVGAAERIQGIYNPDGEAVRELIRLHPVRVHGLGVPVCREHAVLHHFCGIFHIAVSTVIVKDHLHSGVARVKGVGIRGAFTVG